MKLIVNKWRAQENLQHQTLFEKNFDVKMDSIRPAEPHKTFILFYLGMITDKPLQFSLATLVLKANFAG